MKTRFALSVVLALAACREASSDEAKPYPIVVPSPPCEKCTLDAPTEATRPLPLLVVLHGNHEDAATAARRWKDVAVERGYVVLGLHCPRGAGCNDGKWYRWAKTPTWIREQVREVVGAMPIDQTRIYAAGWSGGATALGMHAPELDRTFAAVVFHGGGQPPLATDACPTQEMPAYFLVGDANPAHPAAKRLRSYYERCDHELTWDLLPGANHAREDEALNPSKAAKILDWLEAHARQSNVS
ncbi:MAG: dienelactone hydrolase family protein [Deltaproteobacteria bacterium]|nr:dienelactone hydrolase family protein [Deltaproteobacteria bacterium]